MLNYRRRLSQGWIDMQTAHQKNEPGGFHGSGFFAGALKFWEETHALLAPEPVAKAASDRSRATDTAINGILAASPGGSAECSRFDFNEW